MADKNESCLLVRNVSFAYEKKYPVLHEISFEAAPGETVGIAGANGAGKSTLLKLLVGLETGFEGSIEICGIRLDKKNLAAVRRHIGYVFQDSDSQLFMTTVEEDVAFAPLNYGYSADETKKRVENALRSVNAEHLAKKPVYRLSGGEKRLVSIATILSLTPEVVLMDEPSSGLDPKNRRNLIGIIRDLPGTKLIASHDMDLLWDTCSRILLIRDGRIVCDGPADDIMRNEELLRENDLELPLSLQGRR
ncbi:MAG: ABC transporter ATP-binding protein [Lachnospiraceae bacterium]|nr:ABC transporter ATP-binding protein [Lachnospiraceae bacterium]